MMKAALVFLSVAGLAFSQGRIGPVGHGFGNVVFPGTGIPGGSGSGHVQSLGATVRGVYPAPQPLGPRGPQYRPQGRAIAVPVPVFVGGYGYGGYGYGYGAAQDQQYQQPNITIVNSPQPSPSVIINQNYQPEHAQPAMREYPPVNTGLEAYQAPIPSNPEPPRREPAAAAKAADDDSPTIYLIALNDGTVYPAYAYWLEADTLHYITTKHSHNKASLSLVDEQLSLQLNSERRIDFKLKSK